MNMRKFVAILGMLSFCVLTLPQIARCQEAGKPPTWQPDEARSKRLAAAAKFEGWSIRPLSGYENRTKKDARETRTTWVKQDQGAMSVIQALNPADKITLEQGLDRVVELMKQRWRNVELTPYERGVIDGKTFVRTRYSAEGLPGVAGRGFGFVYATYDAKTPFVITGFGTEKTIEDVEASALTFRILP